MLVERINEVQRVLLTGGIHPFIRKTTRGERSKAPATSFLSRARLGDVRGQRAAQSRRPPVSEPSTCAHTHAGPRTPVSPHVCTPVGQVLRPVALALPTQLHSRTAPRAGGPRLRCLCGCAGGTPWRGGRSGHTVSTSALAAPGPACP